MARTCRKFAAGAGRHERIAHKTSDRFRSTWLASGYLPPRHSTDGAQRAEHHRDKEARKSNLARLVRAHAPLAAAIDQVVAACNGDPREHASFDGLEALIEAQAYRLAFWRVAADEINYRRFFDINELAAPRMENPQVFDATHRLVLDLVASGRVDGCASITPTGCLIPPAAFAARRKAMCI